MKNQSFHNNQPYNSQLLKHLIRFPYFKNELVSKNNPSQINQGYIIKKDIIKTLKEKYALKEIYNILQDNKILDGINYHNCDSNYQNIIQFLNDNNDGLLNGIKRIESNEIQYIFNQNETFISKKFINNNKQSKLIYLDEFEIIDKDFESYLKELYNNKLQILPINYILIEGKIILSINDGQNAIYEIVYINPEGGDIIVEYLIEAPYFINTPYGLNTSIFQIFQNNGLNKIISLGPSFKVDNIIINLHKINGIIVNDSKINKNIVNQSNNRMIQGNQNIIPFPKDKNKYLSNSVLINESNYGNQISCHLINTNNKIKSTNEENPKINIPNFNIKPNDFSNDENKKLINELKYYKEENEKLKEENNKLKSDNNKLNNELNKAKNNISSYQQKIKEINNEMNKLKNIVKEKDKEIYDLKIKSGLYVDYSKIMVVNFISLDYDINCGINCLETETFAEVEEKLYKQYEQCRDTNNAFLSGGNMIKRFKKISENKIKNGDKIQLIIPQ